MFYPVGINLLAAGNRGLGRPMIFRLSSQFPSGAIKKLPALLPLSENGKR